MVHPVNLLPWRQQRSKACRRMWVQVLTFSGLVMVLSLMALRITAHLDRQSETFWLQSDAAVLAALAAKQPYLQSLQQQWLRQQTRMQQQQTTREWQQRLNDLARKMPQDAWLTEIHFQQGQMVISGLAATFSALGEMEQSLNAIPGFHPAQAGVTERDSEGHWQFHYQLNRENKDAQP